MSEGHTALVAVQAAVVAALRASVELAAAAPGGIWDWIPDGATWPYICLDSADEAPDDTLGAQGRIVTLTFAIYSVYEGRAEQFGLLELLVALLRYKPLAVDGWAHGMTDYVGAQAVSPFDVGNQRAGVTLAKFAISVVEDV